MADDRTREPERDLPATIGRPARSALAAAGYDRLDQLAEVTEQEILALHGMGRTAPCGVGDASGGMPPVAPTQVGARSPRLASEIGAPAARSIRSIMPSPSATPGPNAG